MRCTSLLLTVLTVFVFACQTPKKTTGGDGVIILPSGPKKDTAAMALQVKYGSMIGVPPENIGNIKLYQFIDEWLNTPYKWGGTDKKGIDCSAFIQRLLADVYNVKLPRTSEQQFIDQLVERFAKPAYAAEGDLLFFHTMEGKLITHVGLYLANNKFVNANSNGVTITDLNNKYWRSRYVGAGRFRTGAVNSR